MSFSKTVKYKHKVVSAPKNPFHHRKILIVKFAFGYLFSHHTALKTPKMHSQTTSCSKFPGKSMPPPSPLKLAPRAHVWSVSSLDRTLPPKKPPTVLKSENGDFRRLISTEIGSSSYFLRLKHLKPGCFCFETLSVVQGKINFNLFSATNSSRQLESSRRFPFGNWQLPLSHFISAMIVSLWTTPDRVDGVSVRYSVRRRLSESGNDGCGPLVTFS